MSIYENRIEYRNPATGSCSQVARARGLCCETHAGERDRINRASVEAGHQPRENLRISDMTLAERRAEFEGAGGMGERRDQHAEDLRKAAEIAALSGDTASVESYIDLLRESA